MMYLPAWAGFAPIVVILIMALFAAPGERRRLHRKELVEAARTGAAVRYWNGLPSHEQLPREEVVETMTVTRRSRTA